MMPSAGSRRGVTETPELLFQTIQQYWESKVPDIKLKISISADPSPMHRAMGYIIAPICIFSPIISARLLIGPSVLIDTLAIIWMILFFFGIAINFSNALNSRHKTFKNVDDAAAWVKEWKDPTK
jgi:hypothetical protein